MKRTLSLSLAIPLLIGVTSCRKSKVEGLVVDSAVVVTAHPVASRVGREVLRNGGNAVDAAIAVQFALAVTHPAAGNIGGGGFMIVREHNGSVSALDFRERAPARSTADMFLDSTGNVVDRLSTEGHLASGVPGTVDGMVEAHRKFATLPWMELVQPSIDLALRGFPLTEKEAQQLNEHLELIARNNTVQPEFLIRPQWRGGDTIKWIELGHTLERIRDQGRAGFYEGKTASDIVMEMERGKGLISLDDLKEYRSVWRTPVIGSYKNYRIISMPPSSSGGICLMQLLKAVEPFPLRKWDYASVESVHLMVEAERRVYADRARYLGDPEFFNVPMDQLMNDAYNNSRMSTFEPDQATPSEEVQPGSIAGYEPEETTHFSIVDPHGNAVAVTTTINGWFGSFVVVPGSGFFLNNEMDDFSAKPGAPNMFGVLGGEANKIQPGKRMLSAMTPTIVEKDNKLFMVLGTRGGSTIITSVMQVFLNVVEFGMGMQEAVDAKRVHSQWMPDVVAPEYGALDQDDSLELVGMGHRFLSRKSIGSVNAILVLPDGKLEGAPDRLRGDNAADGF